VLAVGGLDNYVIPHPLSGRRKLSNSGTVPTPKGGSYPWGLGSIYAWTDFRNAYAPATTLTGAGQVVGLLELDGYNASDITAYESGGNMTPVSLNNVLLDGVSGTAGAANSEVALDIEMVIAMAPGISQLIVYEGNSGNDILQEMAYPTHGETIPGQISASWVLGENSSTAGLLMALAAEGVSVFFASGDTGAFTSDPGGIEDGSYITFVGGTELSMNGTGMSYQSESVWNDTGEESSGKWASSGGILTSVPIPLYQQGVNMSTNQGSTASRNVPDVAMVADNILSIATDITEIGPIENTFYLSWGTSAASPLWAGFTALVNQQAAETGLPTVGFINPAIYSIGNGASYTSCFHDITTGNNTWSESPTQFYAVPGYDLCTGWGTPTGITLINALVNSIRLTLAPPSITTQPQSESVTVGSSVTFNVTAMGYTPLNIRWFDSGSNVVNGGRFQIVNGADVGGVDTSTLTISNVAITDCGSYYVVVTNVVTSITSSNAVLTVTNVGSTNKIISLGGNLAFGNVTVGTTAQSTLTISNSGNAALTVSGISYPNCFSGNWSSGTISAGGSQNVTVTFAPTSATNYGGTVTVSSDATRGNDTISASGTGVNAAGTRIIDLVPESNLAFGDVQANTTATRVVTIVNEGNTNLDISSITYPTGFSGSWSGGTILHGNQVAMAVYFSPTALSNYSGTMTVNSDATGGTNTLAVSGTGVSPPPPPTNQIPVSGFATLHSFSDTDGNNPQAPLVQGSDGYFYGTTFRGGTYGVGSIFHIASDGTFASLYSFPNQNNTVGDYPSSGLIQGTDGNFYGTTQQGGSSGLGTIFSVTSYGTLNVLYTFTNCVTDGVYWTTGDAAWSLSEGNDGNFYGTTESGGLYGRGNVFCVTPSGTFSNLHSFDGSDGWLPYYDGLVLGSDGTFYGATTIGGNIYSITTNGTFSNLFVFSGTNGQSPECTLVQGNDGNFYGTTLSGGRWGNGTVYRVTPDGTLTSLYSFTGGSDGAAPLGALVQASDGNFYGTTSAGGTNGIYSKYGTIFQITPQGALTTLHIFIAGSEGRNPVAGMVQGQDGNLYGTTEHGGGEDKGTVFRLVIPPTVLPVAQAGNTVLITWSSIAGQSYQVQYNSNLASTNWINVTPQITATTNTTMISDTNTPSQQSYYRIVEFPEAW
jgi:uncharacterized repeat protein (TIGR03803 family)